MEVEAADFLEGFERRWELPFEPSRGFHAVLAETDSGPRLSVKGSPEEIVGRSTRLRTSAGERRELDREGRERLIARAEELAARGLRVLAIAERRDFDTADGALDEADDAHVGGLTFVGFVGLSDPVRETAARAIRRLEQAGVEVMMITGDHPRTAARIAEELGLDADVEVLTGPQIERMGDEELDAHLVDARVIARATPHQKVRIVESLQRCGRIVAMTGDGGNDASAIRLADAGIALGQGASDAAREAADLIVVDGRIETIVDAIAEGRAMWSSVRDAVSLLIGGNLGEIGFTVASGMFGDDEPLNARQLLLVNLLTDVAPALSIALRPPDPEDLEEVMRVRPEEALGEPLDRDISLRATATAAGAAAAWATTRLLPGGRRAASTAGLLAVVGSQLGQTLATGAPTRETVAASVGSAAFLLAVVETPGLSQLFGCRPVGPIALSIAAGSSAAATAGAALGPAVWRRIRALRTAETSR
jgi:magnesium-transporting ATPase (P-type)